MGNMRDMQIGQIDTNDSYKTVARLPRLQLSRDAIALSTVSIAIEPYAPGYKFLFVANTTNGYKQTRLFLTLPSPLTLSSRCHIT